MKTVFYLLIFLVCASAISADRGTYNSLAQAKANLPDIINVGDTFNTLGYYSENDGGSATYIIQSADGEGTDNGSKIKLADKHSGFIAKLVVSKVTGYYEINTQQFGIEGVLDISDLYGGKDYYMMDTFPELTELNSPHEISVDNIIRLMQLSVFIKDDPVLSTEKVRIIVGNNTNQVIPIANTWYITRGNVELKINERTVIYGDVTGYYNDAAIISVSHPQVPVDCTSGDSRRNKKNQKLSSHNGGTVSFANYGTSANKFLYRYVDMYKPYPKKWKPFCRDHKLDDSKWISNVRVYGGGKITNFGRILKETVDGEGTKVSLGYFNGGNENGLSFHKVKNIIIEDLIIDDVGRKALTTQPGGGEIIIKNVEINNAGYYGINLEDNKEEGHVITNLLIENVKVKNTRLANAINIKPLPKNVIIKNNTILNVNKKLKGNAHGIMVKAGDSVQIIRNIIESCKGVGISFGAKYVEIRNNTIKNCSKGVSFYGLQKKYNVDNNRGSITGNIFKNIKNLDISEFVSNPDSKRPDPDWKNISIENNKSLGNPLILHRATKSANIENNSSFIFFKNK